MKYLVSYPLPLHFVGGLGARLCDVVEVGGVPHAVVETSAFSFAGIRLDPAKIRTLGKGDDPDHVRWFYVDAVTMNQAVEIPGEVVSEGGGGAGERAHRRHYRAGWWSGAWMSLRMADASALFEGSFYTGL